MTRWWSASLSPRRVSTGETSATSDPRRCVPPCATGCSGNSSVGAGFTATLAFLWGFYSFSQCLWFRIDYSDLSVWVMYLWPSDPSRVCFCHSPINSLHKLQAPPKLSIISRLQKLVGWVNNRSASYHIQPAIYCLLAGFVNLRPQI